MTKPTAFPTSAHPVFDHLGPWTSDHVLATFPEDRLQRVEVVEGALLVHPRGIPRHQVLVGDLLFPLSRARPPDVEVIPGVNVLLADDTLLVPDLVVCVPGDDGLTVPVADLVLAGEVLSSASRFLDLTWKRKLYAAAGVPFYLLVEPTGPVATMFELENGEYVETARSEAGVLKLERPFPVTIELSP